MHLTWYIPIPASGIRVGVTADHYEEFILLYIIIINLIIISFIYCQFNYYLYYRYAIQILTLYH